MDEEDEDVGGHGLEAVKTGAAKGPCVEVHVLWGEVWWDVVRAAPGHELGLGDAVADELGPLVHWEGETPIVVPPAVVDGRARPMARVEPGKRVLVPCFPYQLVVQRAEQEPPRVPPPRPDPLWAGIAGALLTLGAMTLLMIAATPPPQDTLRMSAAMAMERAPVRSYLEPEPWQLALAEAITADPGECPKVSLPRGDRVVHVRNLTGGCAASRAVIGDPDPLLACFGGEAVGAAWSIPIELDISADGHLRSASAGGNAPSVVQRCVVAALRKLDYPASSAGLVTARLDVTEPSDPPSAAGSS